MDLREAMTREAVTAVASTAMRKRSAIEALAVALLLLMALFPSPVLAQNGAAGPEPCARQLDTCRSECRARIFAVDPRRDVCLKGCSDTEVKCTQAADPRAQLGAGVGSRPVSTQGR